MPPLHFILASIGTDGDVFPYLGIGATLRSRGHRVTLAAGEEYGPRAESLGLSFRPLYSAVEGDELLDNPDFWHPVKGPAVGAAWGKRFLRRDYNLFAGLAGDGGSVFVCSPAVLGARVAAEKFERPLATVLLQPWMIVSSAAPPVMPAGLTLPRWAPWPAGPLYWRAVDAAVAMLLGNPLRHLRRDLGLPPVRRIFRWWLSPDLVLGLFPEWYGPPQPDWPPQVRLVGFPRFDGVAPGAAATAPAPPSIPAGVADFCRAGEAPFAFTFGTGMRHAAALFRACVEACRRTGCRGLLLTRYAEQLPAPLPPSVLHVPFAPFGELFPLCAGVVHHGGIGTLSKALAAGVPQLTLPVAYDQLDNAVRVRRLGAGSWIRARRATAARLAAALGAMRSPAARAGAAAVATRFSGRDALQLAAERLEELAAGRVAVAPA